MSDRDFPKYPCPERHQRYASIVLAILFAICVVMTVIAGTARAAECPSKVASNLACLSWTAPTKNADGSSLTNLSGYVVYFGTTAGGPYTQNTTTTATVITVAPPKAGRWYFVVTAKNSAAAESARSAEVSKLIRPAAPTDGSIERTGASPSK